MTLAAVGNKLTVQVSGTPVEVFSGGSGPPLLFLHGGGGFGTFDPTSGPIAERRTVYAPSLPGFFGTPRPGWVYSVTDMAHFVLELANELGLKDYVLAGHSIGGWTAAEVAAMGGSNIQGLILINAAGIRPQNSEIAEVLMVGGATRLQLAFHNPEQVPNYEHFTRELTSAEAAMDHSNREMLSRLAWKPYLHNPSLPHYLSKVQARTLIIWGANDAIIPLECGETFRGSIPGSQLAIIDNCGHSPQMEKPEEFNAAVAAFLDRL